MRVSKTVLTLSLALLSLGAAAQVNKCTVNGKVQYQQEPCPAGAGSASVHVETPPAAPRLPSARGGIEGVDKPHSDPRLEQLRQNMLQARRDQDEAIARHCDGKSISTPTIGMSEADLFCIPKYRNPATVNVTATAAGQSKQYVYRVRDRSSYIYFINGRLSAMQGELGSL